MFRAWLAGKIVCPKVHFHFEKDGSLCYDYGKDCINLSDEMWKDDIGFLRNLREMHDCEEWNFVGIAVWSLLHEIGHHFTYDFTDDDMETRVICAMVSKTFARDSAEIQDLYYGIESEYEATEWAIDWVQSHRFLARLINKLLYERRSK